MPTGVRAAPVRAVAPATTAAPATPLASRPVVDRGDERGSDRGDAFVRTARDPRWTPGASATTHRRASWLAARTQRPALRLAATGTLRHPIAKRIDPSGIVPFGPGRFLVVNDRGGAHALGLFALEATGNLRFVRDIDLGPDAPVKPEAIARVGDRFVIGGSFEGGYAGDADRRVVSFALDEHGDVTSTRSISVDVYGEVERLLGRPWAKVEGLESDGDDLLIGLRANGATWRRPDYRATALRFGPGGAPASVAFDVDLTPLVGRPEGLSAIRWIESVGQWAIVTSYEGPRGAMGSHLWLAPDLETLRTADGWASLPRITLDGKAEGLCEAGGRLLVVFDPDHARADLREAAFALVDVAAPAVS